MQQEQETCHAAAQNAKQSSQSGLRSDTSSDSLLSLGSSLLLALSEQTEALLEQTESLNRQTEALEILNERILGLLGQTAALVDTVLSQGLDDEMDGSTYLDGSRVKAS